MKKLLAILVLFPAILLGQKPPITKSTNDYTCSYEREVISKKVNQTAKYTIENKQEIDAVQYLISTPQSQAYEYLRNYNIVGQTTMFSEENSLKVVEYFKNEAIYLIDGNLSNYIPINFIEYFRSFDWHAFYQSDLNVSEDYIIALSDAMSVLNNYEPYWEKTQRLNDWRFEVTLVLDIDGHRSKVYDLILLNLEKSSNEFMFQSTNTSQVQHVAALANIIWRAFDNNDQDFILKTLEDPLFFELINNVIQNETLGYRDEKWIQYNFILNYKIILSTLLNEEWNWYDSSELLDFVFNEYSRSVFGENLHIRWVDCLKDIPYDFGINFEEVKQGYYDLNFTNQIEYDDSSIKIYSEISADRIKSTYLSLREARSNFFKLTGKTEALIDDTNEIINVYIFSSFEDYNNLGGLLFDIPTNNGGIYIESDSAFYTFDRKDPILTLDALTKHEYVHYLDGRYNIPGGFSEEEFYDWDYGRSVFWVEGLANFVASANTQNGYYISEFSSQYINEDFLNNRSRSLQESIRTGYDKPYMYPYSEAAWSFLYTVAYEEVLEMLDLIRSREYEQYFIKLDSLAFNQSLEIQYQEYLENISNNWSEGTITDPASKRYDFTQPEVSIDSIQIAFKSIGLSDFTLEESYRSPHRFTIAKSDTIVNNIKDVHRHLERITSNASSETYSGYSIITAQIDSYNSIGNRYLVNYSVELPNVGVFKVEEPEDINEPKVMLYPNPAVAEINVIELSENTDIYIYDINGNLVEYRESVSGVFNVNVSNYSAGIYILNYVGEKSGSIKFVKR